MAEELKRCPFCGGKAVFCECHAAPDEEPKGFFRCENMCCEQCHVLSKSKAEEDWNRRCSNG